MSRSRFVGAGLQLPGLRAQRECTEIVALQQFDPVVAQDCVRGYVALAWQSSLLPSPGRNCLVAAADRTFPAGPAIRPSWGRLALLWSRAWNRMGYEGFSTRARSTELYEPQQLWRQASPLSRVCLLSLLALGVFWCVARFWGLETAPYGIWMDESRVALHTACLAETGQPAGAEYWPWFAPAFGGGHHPSLLIYFELLWTKLFGNSIASFRAAIALVNIVTIAGLTLLARRLGGALLALMVFLSAAISPWSFQFSRIVWEGPLAAASLVLAVYCLMHAARWYWAVAAGVCGGLAMFCYPPLRITTPLVLGFVGVLQLCSRTRRWRWAPCC
jgi:hypothetical protein